MKHRIYDYFFLSLFLLVGGVAYLLLTESNRIVIDNVSAQTEEKESVKKELQSIETVVKATNKEQLEDSQEVVKNSAKEELQSLQGSEIKSERESGSQPSENQSGINLNTADKEALMSLIGIGEKKAEDILQYRKKHGNFRKIEDIMKIRGIKKGLFEKIKDRIYVSD